jgi:hypothetical protein
MSQQPQKPQSKSVKDFRDKVNGFGYITAQIKGMGDVRQVNLKDGTTKNIRDIQVRDMSMGEQETITLAVWQPENVGVTLEVGGIYYFSGLSSNEFRGEMKLSTGKNTKIEKKTSMVISAQQTTPAATTHSPDPQTKATSTPTSENSNAIAIVSSIMAMQSVIMQKLTEVQTTIMDQLKVILDHLKPKT